MKPTIYLAARYSRRGELCVYRQELADIGFTVTSRWLNGAHQISDIGLSEEGSPEERLRFATEDWDDLRRADICIAFTEEPRSGHSRGGRHVELGAALAWNKTVVIVGPRENVFCCLEQVHRFAVWGKVVLNFIAILSGPEDHPIGIALHLWRYRFKTVNDAAHFHDLMVLRGESSEWIEREVRTPLAPHAAFPLWYEICRFGGYGEYVSADKVTS